MKVCIGGGTEWLRKNAAGVAYVGSFGGSDFLKPCFTFSMVMDAGRDVKGIIEVTSHEIGHTVGLLHDGTSITATDDYYAGKCVRKCTLYSQVVSDSALAG